VSQVACPTLFDLETTNWGQSVPSFSNSESSQPDQSRTRSLLTVAATGLGKTVIMAGLARSWPIGRVMMISHRYELNTQAIRSFESICGVDVDLEQAGYMADQRTQRTHIVVASVQSLNSMRKGRYRMERFDPNEFGLLLIDEAHRSAAASYQRVVSHFQKNPNLKLVGVTATPDRLDGVGLGCLYDDVACNYDINWGIKNGWLVAPRQVIVELQGLDLREVKTVGGDLDQNQLAKVVQAEENLHGMAKPIVDFAGRDKQAIVFAASVAHAHRLAELIRDYYHRQHGYVDASTAVSLDGSMNPQDPRRQQIVKDFKDGAIQFLVNCGVATEGFDAPGVRLVAIGRPTKSRALYVQMLGRGTRPIPGTVEDGIDAEARLAAIQASVKPHCDVLDFVGQSGRHSLLCASDILAGGEPPEVVDRANKISSNKDFDGSTIDALKQAKEQLAAEQEARRKKVTVGVKYSTIESGSTAFERANAITTNLVKPGVVTQKQASFLIRLGYKTSEIESITNRGHIQRLIDAAKKNPRNGFAKWLAKQEPPKPAASDEGRPF
jgi:superfamily II DNA or RNA helicase